ncbi:MAG: hypothetical protein ABIA91_01125 [Patescibacteria group bacterium]
MILIKRIVPFFLGILNLVILEIVLKQPSLVSWLSSALFVLTLLSIWFLVKKSLGFKPTLRFVLIFGMLIVAEVASLLFIEHFLAKHFLIVLTSLVLLFYAEYLFLFLYDSGRYKAYSLENLNNFVNLFNFLLLSIAIFAFMVFMNISIWIALVGIFVLSVISFLLSFKSNKIELVPTRVVIIVGTILILELFIVLNWLPFSFYLKAIVLTSFYYLINGLFRLKLTESLNRKVASKYVFIFLAVWFISLLTARWT